MGATDEPELKSTEEKILEAAEKEFMQKGYAGARTTTIAGAAGVTHAMLHYYFRTKDKLFEKIIEKKTILLRDIMLSSIGIPDMPLFEKLESVIEKHLDFIASNPDLPRFMICEVFSQPERTAIMLSKLQAHAPLIVASLQHQIDEYADKGLCRRVDAGNLILDIVSLNIFPFMATPLANPLLGGVMENKETFVAIRKKNNIETIMKKLKP